MKIDENQIIHIAKLADLNLNPNEVSNYTESIEEILNFIEIINNIETNNIKETVSANETFNVFRKDEIKKPFDREELLKNAPSQEDGMFRIPKVIN